MEPARILITYASRCGSTTEIGKAIGDILRRQGAWVAVCPLHYVQDLDPYRAVVIGSPIRNRQWLPEAQRFVHKNQEALRQKPSAMFTVCMTLAMRNGKKYRPQVAEWVSPMRKMIQPNSEELFAGVLDISKIPSFSDRLKFRLSTLFGFWKEGDHRDWAAINTWGSRLYINLLLETQLHPQNSPSTRREKNKVKSYQQ